MSNSGDIEIAKFPAWDKSKKATAAFIVSAVNIHFPILGLLYEVASLDVDHFDPP